MKHLISAIKKMKVKRDDHFTSPSEYRWNDKEKNAVMIFGTTFLAVIVSILVCIISYYMPS